MKQVSLEDAQLTVLFELDGQMHLVTFNKDDWDAVQLFVKFSAKGVARTKRSQKELNEFIGYNKQEESK